MVDKNKDKSSVYLGYSGQRYVYYNKVTKKRTTGSTKKFKSIKQFKRYITNKGYLFGLRDYNKRAISVEYKDSWSIETEERLSSKHLTEYRITAYYEDNKGRSYTSTSSPGRMPRVRWKDNELKEQAIQRLLSQIIGNDLYGMPTPPSDDEVENMYEQYRMDFDADNVIFKYVYYRPK